MDQYVTSYRKDYLWPYVRTYPLRGGPTYATVLPPSGPFEGVPCTCGGGPGGEMPIKETVAPNDADSYEWSRLGPMGPLLDPKLYPAKVGASPETPSMRINQPNTYLKKVFEISVRNTIEELFKCLFSNSFKKSIRIFTTYCKARLPTIRSNESTSIVSELPIR